MNIRPDITNYISKAEYADVINKAHATHPQASAEVRYVGSGTWKATIYGANGLPVAWKQIPEKPGAPGGWNHGEYAVGVWTLA